LETTSSSERGGAAVIHFGGPALNLPGKKSDMEQPTVPSLREMVGTLIVARIPALDKDGNVFVRLHRVEMSGIWVESKTFNQDMLEKYEIPASITTLVLFVPFSGIEYIISSVECVSLSDPEGYRETN
jgi:hypothetical protein